MKVLAIVVTYNGMQWYEHCFGSLQKSSCPIDIFVVDNASSDGSAAYIRAHFPEITLVESDRNLGFGQANNKGMRYALDNGYDFVFLLNQDAWLINNDCIANLAAQAQINSEYGIVSPLHLYGSGERLTRGMKKHITDRAQANNDLFSDLLFHRELKDIYDIDYVCAAAWLLPIKTLREIGGFDPLFFHYGEDDNYMQRVHYHGYKLGLCPQAVIGHDVEFRGDDYGKENNNWEKNMLIELADVNVVSDLKQRKRQAVFKIIQQGLFFRFKSVSSYMKTYHYIRKNAAIIKNSINNNKAIFSNWL